MRHSVCVNHSVRAKMSVFAMRRSSTWAPQTDSRDSFQSRATTRCRAMTARTFFVYLAGSLWKPHLCRRRVAKPRRTPTAWKRPRASA